jgi:TolB-like protein/Flp pilus assembly protein TadD
VELIDGCRMLTASTRLGPYEIIGPLGAGGMGEVYRARDARLGREVAVKILPDRFASDPDRLARFEREARLVAALSHPNVLAIHDYGTEGRLTFAVTELLEGETLRSRLARGPLAWRDAVDVGAAVAEGLAAAHAKGIIHRDLKPENLFLTLEGHVKILDFGLARADLGAASQGTTGPYLPGHTDPGTVMGTAGYMSPEQVRGEPVDERTDIFSFGCVLYEMVTGRRAFQRPTAAETMTEILHAEPPAPGASGLRVPTELARIIARCLAKSASQRLRSARDLALSLRTTAGDHALPARAGARGRSWVAIAAVAAVLVIGVASAVMYYLRGRSSPATPDSATAKLGTVEALAVLPFESIGGDLKTEYLSDGIADQIINCLHELRRPDLKIRPFTSVSRYKKGKADPSTIAQELNVGMVVTGTVRQQGDDLLINVELVDARQDNRIWGGRYMAKLGAILDVQDQIAREVAANLRLRLSGEEEQRLTRRGTQSPQAYLFYREAMYHFNKRDEKSLMAAVDYCQRALAQDPHYALAHDALARTYFALGNFYQGPRKVYPEAKKHVDMALQLDEHLADAHSTLAALYLFDDWNWDAAERELKQALALDANVPRTWNNLGFCRAAKGRLPEALADIERAQEVEPLAPLRRNDLAMCYNWLRRYDDAISEARKALELEPRFAFFHSELGLSYIEKKMYAQAIAQLQQEIDHEPGRLRASGLLGCAYAKAGRLAEAHRVLDALVRNAPTRFGSAFAIARIHAALDEKDQAFAWLQRACDERDPLVIWLKVDLTVDALRADPRFASLLRNMGLPP